MNVGTGTIHDLEGLINPTAELDLGFCVTPEDLLPPEKVADERVAEAVQLAREAARGEVIAVSSEVAQKIKLGERELKRRQNRKGRARRS